VADFSRRVELSSRPEIFERHGRTLASAYERLHLGSLVAIAAALLFLVGMWLAYPEVGVSATYGVAAFVGFAGALHLANRRWRPERWNPAMGSALLVAMSAGIVHAFVLTGQPAMTAFALLHLIAAGALHSHTRWLIVSLVTSVAIWLAAGFATMGTGFAMYGVAMACTALLAFTLHLVLKRYVASLELLRARDLRHRDELSGALAAAQRELVERQRAEAERERLREQLLHAQKLEGIGTLAGGIAHDMNNVLAAIVGLAEHMRSAVTGSAAEDADQIIAAARRGSELTRNLLGFSRRGRYRVQRLDLTSVATSVVQLLSRTLPKGIEITTEGSLFHAVEGDSAQLSQALVNLCINSADAMNGNGKLSVVMDEVVVIGKRAEALGLHDARYVTLAVSDTGCGMDRETQARMFEPFFTTKPPGRGTGLGLAMVYGTIANHHGAIQVDSEPGQGTTITIYLPAVEPVAKAEAIEIEKSEPIETAEPVREVAAAVQAVAALPVVGAPETQPAAQEQPRPEPDARPARAGKANGDGAVVLLVDDEPMVRSVTRRSLERAGYQVITASDGAEGVERFQERGADISVVLLDMAMPVMGGAECFRNLRALRPGVRVLLASGYALEQEARDCLAAGALGFLEKPFTTARLLDALARARRDLPLDASFELPPLS
jgi:signal transduction histidine kinase/CheY-like chemotaxis protein